MFPAAAARNGQRNSSRHHASACVGPGCKSGPAGFKGGQAFTAVYDQASWLYSWPACFKTGRPAIKPVVGFQAGQVYNRALTYILAVGIQNVTL